MGKGADRTGNGTGGDFGARMFQPCPAADKLGIKAGQLQSKGCRFGMNAVAAPDRGCVAMFLGACFQRRQQAVNPLQQQIAGPRHLYRQGGVQHIG